MPGQQTRELLLGKGAEIMHRKGFHDSGIQEVLESTGVPKGSFYYYFKSKEDFGLQVIDIYAGVMFGVMEAVMKNADKPVTGRLKEFFRAMTEHAVKSDYTGCPLGNLSQEMGSASEAFRQKLNKVFDKLEKDIAGYLGEAQKTGEVRETFDPKEFAIFLSSSWEGALLRMKLTRDTVPYEIFERTAFKDLPG